MREIGRLVVLTMAMGFVSCSQKPKDETVTRTMLAVIEANVGAMERHDFAGVMATIHPASPLYAETHNAMTQIVNLPVAFEFEKVEVVSASATEARVDYVQVTRSTSDEIAFRENRITGTHVLRPDGDTWKIYTTRIQKIDYLDPKLR